MISFQRQSSNNGHWALGATDFPSLSYNLKNHRGIAVLSDGFQVWERRYRQLHLHYQAAAANSSWDLPIVSRRGINQTLFNFTDRTRCNAFNISENTLVLPANYDSRSSQNQISYILRWKWNKVKYFQHSQRKAFSSSVQKIWTNFVGKISGLNYTALQEYIF